MNPPLIFIKTTHKSRIEQKHILTPNLFSKYLHAHTTISKNKNIMALSIERPLKLMYQFEKSWSSKTYQFGGTVVIQLVFGDQCSKQMK
jgi:hypothetical protein